MAPLAAIVVVGGALSLPGCSHLIGSSNAGIPFLEEWSPAPVATVSRGAKYAGWILSAPLVLAMAPVAAAAWATPWVDLAGAVDIASAPAIGLGYVFECAVGFPLYGALFWLDREEARPAVCASPEAEPPGGLPWGLVAAHCPAARTPRHPEPVPPDIDRYYGVSDDAVTELGASLAAAARVDAQGVPVVVRPGAGFPSTLEYYRAPGGGEPRPLCLLTPPTKAVFAARYLAKRYADRGVHAAVVVPDATFLETDLAPRDVERKFHSAVVTARTVLRAVAGLDEVDDEQLLYLGVSAGGIFGAVLMAVEPGIRRAVLILPGGDLPRIVLESDESSVTAYRDAWKERGVEPEALSAAFEREVRTDPLRLGAHVDPRRLLLFLGASDTRVPTATGLALRKALGDPELYVMAGNHETASLCFGFILRTTDAFLLADESATR